MTAALRIDVGCRVTECVFAAESFHPVLVATQFDYKICQAPQLATLGIQISQNALNDHALTAYEESLHYLMEEQQQQQQDQDQEQRADK